MKIANSLHGPVGMKLLVLCLLVAACHGWTVRQQRRFPDDFLFGAATASYQIEGGWDADGKGENIWDRLVHSNPTVIQDLTNGDVAADSYHNYKRDVEMMRELGLDAYRFSLSWARILPTGMANEVNPAGVAYYNNLINELVKYNITPMVTLYHWDLPQKLQDLGGFMNPLFTDWFEDYARVVFENFGDRVKSFITFNEPREICFEGLEDMNKAPLLNTTGVGVYLCAKHLVLAHARAYHLYNNEFKPTQGGQCGITISVNWFEADTDSAEDLAAAELMRQAQWGIYAEPIFSSEGGFPKEFSERVAEKSAQQGFPRSRLPEFTEEEKAFVKGSSDFFGVNHYTTLKVSASKNKAFFSSPSMMDDVGVGFYAPEEYAASASPWLKLAPNSIYYALTHLNEKYNRPTIYITENGWSTYPDSGLIDEDRITYYRAAWESALNALDAGVNLKGYMVWSLLDNMEWLEGYIACFGLYQVDYQDPARTRTARKSAFVYKHLIKNRYIDYEYEPESLTMTIDDGF
uniref:Cytosolic beta-glucosidase n=1 Tax=Spodoptera frugiperda TaxID=7108 RepID=A0A2H1VWZ6_SPOFR